MSIAQPRPQALWIQAFFFSRGGGTIKRVLPAEVNIF